MYFLVPTILVAVDYRRVADLIRQTVPNRVMYDAMNWFTHGGIRLGLCALSAIAHLSLVSP